MNWLSNLFTYYLYFFTDSKIGDLTSLYMVAVSMVLRLSSIANKYATYTPQQMNMVRQKNLSLKDLEREMMMFGWADQKPDMVREEIESAVNRLEIDRQVNYISFFKQKNSEKLQEELEKLYEVHKDLFRVLNLKSSYIAKKGNKEVIYYNGTLIIEYLIQKYNKKNNSFLLRIPILMIAGGIYGTSGGLVRLYHG